MFDNLRDFSDEPLYEDESNDLYKEPEDISVESNPAMPDRRRRRNNGKLLGMTAQQRFIISLMLMFTVCLIGTLAMFVMGKMSIF
jgi:hypothetical protein